MNRIIFQILLYILICVVTVVIYTQDEKKNKSIKNVIIVSLLFTLYNVICTNLSTRIDGDRANYFYEFMGYRETSAGLTFIFNFVKLFSNNMNIVYYLITFICSFITFYCLFNEKYANIYALVFLLITDFVFFTFFALKQCVTCAIASLIFYLIFNKKGNVKYIFVAILVYIACLFHSTGLLIIPVALIFFFYRNKKINPFLLIIIFSIIMLSFDGILTFLTQNFGNIMPTLTEKINEYFYSDGTYIESQIAFLKGIPFYVVLWMGIINYKKYEKEKNYDKLLILAFIGAFAYFITFISYWMYRITALFYLPIAVLFGIVFENEENIKNKNLYFILCILLETVILLRWLYLEFATGGF